MGEHYVSTAYERGWSALKNGDLLYQQDLGTRSIAIVVLGTTSWPRIRGGIPAVIHAVNDAAPGSYLEAPFPTIG